MSFVFLYLRLALTQSHILTPSQNLAQCPWQTENVMKRQREGREGREERIEDELLHKVRDPICFPPSILEKNISIWPFLERNIFKYFHGKYDHTYEY